MSVTTRDGIAAMHALQPSTPPKELSRLAQLALPLPGGGQREFFYRPDSRGDQGVIQQIFQHADYAIVPEARFQTLIRYAAQRAAEGKRPGIIDAGANIGASAVYFALQYPSARLIAIEPEKANADLLRRNCAGLDVIVQEAALGADGGIAYLTDPGEGDWGFRVEPTGTLPVRVITVPQILASEAMASCFPFICKIDIEGGESGLFSRNVDWVDSFALIIIELHDWLLPGQSNSQNFLRAISDRDFDFLHRGENIFCFNNRLLAGGKRAEAIAAPDARVTPPRPLSASPIPGLSIIVVGLESRADRRRESTQELQKLGLDPQAYRFFDAKPTPENGARGCALSHALALSQWLFDTTDEHCLIFEDDFAVRQHEGFWDLVKQALSCQHGWDVFMLASNLAVPAEATPIANVYRVFNALTMSAYIVNRSYAPRLIELFLRSAELLRRYGALPTIPNQSVRTFLFACDSLWRNYQTADRFWGCLPQLCYQRASFSDVEQRVTDYGV